MKLSSFAGTWLNTFKYFSITITIGGRSYSSAEILLVYSTASPSNRLKCPVFEKEKKFNETPEKRKKNFF